MIQSGFVNKIELADEEVPTPYYAIVLTPEQAKLIEHSKLEFFSCDGKTIFSIRDKGKEIGVVMYVMFVMTSQSQGAE